MNRRTCPKCGGDAGYMYRLVVPYDQWLRWDGDSVGADSVIMPAADRLCGRIGECVDCGYRFNISRLSKESEQTQEGGEDG